MTGVVIALVVLSAATIVGVVWRRANGVLRPPARPDAEAGARVPASTATPAPTSVAMPASTLAPTSGTDPGEAALALGPEFGPKLGERATLVQFSSAFCAPCRATRRILGEVAEMVEGVRFVEIDAEDRLDLVRRLGVLRTPTVLVLDGAGRIVRRGSGLPRKADVIAALGVAIPEPAGDPSRETSRTTR
ncbi:MAG TPA: thioredoxin family protein [Streptosporangiaceae bacterium]|nr:thioredoxin family protein [Streptosporangiaceae bacterium]